MCLEMLPGSVVRKKNVMKVLEQFTPNLGEALFAELSAFVWSGV